ncbi:potassium channel family protein [Actinoplanes sp. CA-051413]|uniref:potassium channel family protein n=1 Tax=Actinoplanes sp. CA-051413 TaxID=3239899 RepID=UPI003D965AE6
MSGPEQRTDADRYGLVFTLLLASFLTAAFLSSRPSRVVTILLFAAALVLALRFTDIPSRRSRRLRGGLLVGSVIVAALAAVASGRLVDGLSSLWLAGILLFTVYVVVRRVLHHRVVSMQTLFGALSAYLLIGFVFSALFAATAALTTGPLFADGGRADGSTIQYFAFVTLTTTGYGDLTPAGQPGRSLAVLEALLGQIFLVTLVARLVSVFGTERYRPSGDVADDR